MIDGRRTYYDRVLSIPARKVGAFEIRHERKPAGTRLPMNTSRTMLFGQRGPRSVYFAEPTVWHTLASDDDGVWMTDLPIEQRQHDEMLRGMTGTVLVGGLGLGYAATVLARRPRVKRIVVVEIAGEVIELVERAMRERIGEAAWKIEVVQRDLFAYLQDREAVRKRAGARGYEGGPEFTHAFYDIWQSDGEATFWDVVLPLIQASRGVVRNRPRCWNEDVMRGQLYRSLVTNVELAITPPAWPGVMSLDELATLVPPDDPTAKWRNWRVPFFEWVRRVKPDVTLLNKGAQFYVSYYGVHEWESMWAVWMDVQRRAL